MLQCEHDDALRACKARYSEHGLDMASKRIDRLSAKKFFL